MRRQILTRVRALLRPARVAPSVRPEAELPDWARDDWVPPAWHPAAEAAALHDDDYDQFPKEVRP